MEPQPVKCLHCDTWNLPEAKFCKNCGEDLEYHRKLAEIEREIELKEKILSDWAALSEEDDEVEEERLSQKNNGGCASVILLMITFSCLGYLIL